MATSHYCLGPTCLPTSPLHWPTPNQLLSHAHCHFAAGHNFPTPPPESVPSIGALKDWTVGITIVKLVLPIPTINSSVNLPASPRTGRRSTSDVGGELASHCSREGGEGQTHPFPTANLKRTQVSLAAERTSSVVFASRPPATPSSRAEGLDGGHNHSKVGIAHSHHQL